MKENRRRVLWFTRILILVFLARLVALVFYAPVVPAIVFITLVAVLAVAKGKTQGFWNGIRMFVREILFAW
jgi:hypothetical protein